MEMMMMMSNHMTLDRGMDTGLGMDGWRNWKK